MNDSTGIQVANKEVEMAGDGGDALPSVTYGRHATCLRFAKSLRPRRRVRELEAGKGGAYA